MNKRQIKKVGTKLLQGRTINQHELNTFVSHRIRSIKRAIPRVIDAFGKFALSMEQAVKALENAAEKIRKVAGSTV